MPLTSWKTVCGFDFAIDVVIVACAVSAGIHGALAPRHFDEGTPAGTGFAAATIVLGALVVWLTRRPASVPALAAAAATLAGLLASYALATTSGVPALHPHPEPVDGLALVTKSVEIVGLLAAASLLAGRAGLTHPRRKGALT